MLVFVFSRSPTSIAAVCVGKAGVVIGGKNGTFVNCMLCSGGGAPRIYPSGLSADFAV